MYQAICGSRSYQLNLPKSDYDIIICGDKIENSIENSHQICHSTEWFVRALSFFEDAYRIQLFYPDRFLINSQLISYIKENREEIIAKNKINLYNSYFSKSLGLSYNLEKLYKNYPKRAMYSNLFYDSLYRYATQDISFQEAFIPEEAFRQWLLAVRQGKIPIEELLKRNEELRKKAESVKDFYNNQDKIYLNNTISDLNDILNTKVELL